MFTAYLIFALATSQAQPPQRRFDPERIHDPSTVIHQGDGYYVVGTGRGLPVFKESHDGSWRPLARIFGEGQSPAWHEQNVPGNRGSLWAPDVIKRGDKHFLYYSVSTFGKQRSAIALAVGKTLDPTSPDWQWEDRGPVIESREGDDYNTIDPAIFVDPNDNRLWMVYGSYWKGIHLIELDPATGMRLHPETPPVRLAWKEQIEAAFICNRDGYYYLFINWGSCCQGVDSTYEIRIGRSAKLTGPYVDKEGKDLLDGGGSTMLAAEGRYIGPGHASLLERDGQEWLVHHFYDGENEGRARLRMVPIEWKNGWPLVKK